MPKQGQTRSDAGEAEQGAQELVVSNVRPRLAKGKGRQLLKVMTVAHHVELNSDFELLVLQQVLYDAGFCFIQCKPVFGESLEACERRLKKEGLC